jgi:hypothetical protein
VPKLDDLNKHNGRRKCIHSTLGQKIGEFYTSFNTPHAKNERMYAIIMFNSIFNK